MSKSFFTNSFFKSKVSLKLLVLTLFFSAFITLIVTLIQLYIDYKHGYNTVNRQITLVENSYLDSLEQSIWVYDEEQIQLQLHGMLTLPDIVYAEVSLKSKEVFQLGTIVNDSMIKKTFSLEYIYNNQKVELGTLTVIADLRKLYQ